MRVTLTTCTFIALLGAVVAAPAQTGKVKQTDAVLGGQPPLATRDKAWSSTTIQAAWREALSKGLPVDAIVTFKTGTGFADRRPERPEPSGSSNQTSIEERSAVYSNVKKAAFARVGDGIEVVTDYAHLPMSFVRLHSLDALDRLAALEDVEGIFENRVNHPIGGPNLTLIGQPPVAAAGAIGSGVTVAVLDGPVDFTNSAFGCTSPGFPSSCGVVYSKSFGTGGNSDAAKHGTNVAGIVRDVAPGTKVISLDVFNGIVTSDSVWLQAADWCVANKSAYSIAAVNMSFGGGDYVEPCAPSPYETAFNSVRGAGMIPVAAAGNDGSATALGSPACAPSAISVGAVYDESFGSFTWPESPMCTDSSTAPDLVPCFSQSAFFLSMLAPGAPITSAGLTYAGTSQAAPHVAGSVAVLRAGIPSDSLGTTMQRLLTGGKPVTDPGSHITTPRLQLNTAWFGPYPTCKTAAISLPYTVSDSLLSNTCSGVSPTGLVYYYNNYTFAGVAGQQVSAAVNSSSYDTFLSLLDPSGNEAASGQAQPGTTPNSALTFTLTSTGTWTFGVSSYWPSATGAYSFAAAVGTLQTGCVASATTLCLENSRFGVTASWRRPDGTSGTGNAIPLTDDTGAFWFFSPSNYEMMMKSLDGCGLNSHYWIFAGGLTNVEVTLTVTDTRAGTSKQYTNPQGAPFQPIQDTTAFATCP